MTYVPNVIEKAARDLIASLVDESLIDVIYPSQRRPVPTKPFITVNPVEEIGLQVKAPYYLTSQVDPDGSGDFIARQRHEREVTVSVQAFGPHAYETLSKIQRDLRKPTSRYGILEFRRARSLTRLYETLETEIESRAQITLMFGVAQVDEFTYPAISKVVATGSDDLEGIEVDQDL